VPLPGPNSSLTRFHREARAIVRLKGRIVAQVVGYKSRGEAPPRLYWANSGVIVGVIGGEPFGSGCGQKILVGGYKDEGRLDSANQWLV
jgi:hypothetical protein